MKTRQLLSLCAAAVAAAAAFTGCASQEGVYADVIGFNNDAYRYFKPYDLKSAKDSDKLKNIILTKIPRGQNTAEYYAMDVALDRIAERLEDYEDYEKSVRFYTILLTDGLDNVSLEMARKNGKGDYSSLDEYATAIQERMGTILNSKKMFGLISSENKKDTFQSFPMMFVGEDAETYSDDELMEKLRPLAGAQNAYVPTPITANSLQKLNEKFRQEFKVTSFGFNIPKGYLGRRIKMKLTSDDGETVHFEADFVRHEESGLLGLSKKEEFRLENFSFDDGFSFEIPEGGFIPADNKDDKTGNLAHFIINDMKLTDGEDVTKFATATSEQYYYDGGKPRLNSEYNQAAAQRSDAYIIFLLDTSESLSEKQEEVRLLAYDMIEFIKKQILK